MKTPEKGQLPHLLTTENNKSILANKAISAYSTPACYGLNSQFLILKFWTTPIYIKMLPSPTSPGSCYESDYQAQVLS